MLYAVYLALCLVCLPVVVQAESLVFTDQVDATVTQWDYAGPGWTHGKFAARLRFPFGLGDSTYGTSSFWLRSTRPGGTTFGEIAIMSAYDSDEPGEYAGLLDIWSPYPYVRATRELSIYSRRDLTRWHTYAVVWHPGSIRWYLDGVLQARTTWVPGDGSAWNVLDREALVPSIRTNSYYPVVIDWVKIWQ